LDVEGNSCVTKEGLEELLEDGLSSSRGSLARVLNKSGVRLKMNLFKLVLGNDIKMHEVFSLVDGELVGKINGNRMGKR
jgi:hypothetical protein